MTEIGNNVVRHVNIKGKSEFLKTGKYINHQDPYTKIDSEQFLPQSNEQRVSPLGRTSSAWKLTDKQNDGLLNQQIRVYRNQNAKEKNSTAYLESSCTKKKCAKRHMYNGGVRMSGRRFTNAGSAKNKIIGDQHSYECNEMYKSNGYNPKNFSKFVDHKIPDFNASTPQKNSSQSIYSKLESENVKRRGTIYSSIEENTFKKN